jgi:hypothetical protein
LYPPHFRRILSSSHHTKRMRGRETRAWGKKKRRRRKKRREEKRRKI